ncbi:MAG: hypothetical protein VX404_07795 [Planctomycetota bacterium]|nr:hypothetical protein [Planctomycetota bacterium]
MHKRRRIRPVYLSLATVLITLVAMSGCAVPGYNEREAMLFEDKLHAELKAGSFSPGSDHFSGGTGPGIRFSYEYEYGMHFGFQLTSIHGVDGESVPGPAIGESMIGSSDRDTFTINFDWEVPVSKDGNVPYFRYGFGAGLLSVKNRPSPAFLAASSDVVRIPSQPMFLLSPSASLRWDMVDTLSLFVEAQYDIASHDLVVDVNGDGDRYGDVDYGGFMGFVGIDYSF